MRKSSSDSDEYIVLQVQSGNVQALPELVKRWHKQFCYKAYWLTKNSEASKDIAQDCWKIIIDKIGDLKTPKSFGSWSLRIVYSKSLDWLRAEQRNRFEMDSYAHFQKITEEPISENEERHRLLLKAVAKLPEPQRMVIHLFYVEDYSLNEIGNILNISIGTAKSRLFHAREKLKQTLNNKNYEK